MRVAPAVVMACAVAVCPAIAWGTQAASEETKITEGSLVTREGKQRVDVPLEHTDVKIHATGFLATVDVEQTFHNPYDKKIEAVYLFPLPTGAAVNQMEIVVGDKTIAGSIQKREEAKRIYTRARDEGQVAALLTEERPNLFTQSVANLEPGARIVVRLRYVQALDYSGGGYEIVFPMVAGPRYMPKSSKQAADAPAVQPSVLPPGMRSSHEITLAADIDAGVPITGLRSPSHQIAETHDGAMGHVAIAAGDNIPNKDFILRYDVAGEQPAFALRAHRDAAAGDGSFFLMMQPPADAVPDEITAKELVFVIDTSSSMKGKPLAKAKEMVKTALAGMGPDDTFQLIRFSDASSALGGQPIANKPKNVAYATQWIDALDAQGGTEMSEGISAALDFAHDPARLRVVMFLTDGYIGNEDEVLALVGKKLGASRLFSFGVGTAVNRYLLEEMATMGRGAVQIVRPDEDTAAAVEKFQARIAKPVLTDITIDWNGLAVKDSVPDRVPDLFLGQPIILSGHYRKAGAANIMVHGTAAGRAISFSVAVTLPEAKDEPAVATVWARARIAELTRQQIRGEKADAVAEITALGLANHMLTPYTAFVAVDTSRVTKGDKAQTVAVPVEVPDGLAYPSSGGGGYGYGSAGVSRGYSYAAPRGEYMLRPEYDSGGYGGGIDVDRRPAPKEQLPELEKKVVNDAPAASGALAVDQYRAAIRRHVPELRRCYEAALKKNPDLEGKLVLSFTIDEDGKVASITTTSAPSGGEELQACAEKVASGWRFPAGGNEIRIVYPFNFVKPSQQK